MKSIPKLIRRFVGILLLSSVLLLILNVTILIVYTLNHSQNSRPWQTARKAAVLLSRNEIGYTMPEDMLLTLKEEGAWAIFIENQTLQAVWATDNLPESVPLSYSASAIASLTRGYIDGYPTFTGEAEDGLMVLGYPKDSFWKHMWPSWDYHLIAGLPKTALSVFGLNVALIFVIYVAVNSRLLNSVKPIVSGIQALSTGESVSVREKGLLSELAANINRTGEILQSQALQLRKKETARANWIAGVSHDIRTPLSMVMGYAGQLENDESLPEDSRRKAAVIVKQSQRMRNLINDLNLSSKLEYNMQPVNPARQNLTAIVRQAAADFANTDLHGRYPIQWDTGEDLAFCAVDIDRDLISRALGNLLQNSMNHNPRGCRISIRLSQGDDEYVIIVADDGRGVDDAQLEKLNHAPHYMVCDENTSTQRHGLGLLLVKQIIAAHGGSVALGHSAEGGFSVSLRLPKAEDVSC